MIEIRIGGIPAAKGSYRPVKNRKTGKTLFLPASKKEPLWRKTVRDTIRAQGLTQIPADAWIRVDVDFFLPRPKTVPPRKRFRPTVPIDLDKALRSTFDGITESGLIVDDAPICETHARKYYADNGFVGCILRIDWARNAPTCV